MSSRHEGKFCKVFQVDLQDQVYNRLKYQKILLLPQPVSPILVFYLNSGTPPYHNLLESTVESLASWSLSLRLKLIARLFDCFVQLSLSRVVFSGTLRV